MKPHELTQLKAETGLSEGVLPVRYLGVPLCTKKLSMLHCAPLLQAIKSKLHSWTVKSLSFAGRFQLLSTVIAGITNFWSCAFIIPKACVDERLTLFVVNFCGRGKLMAPTLRRSHGRKSQRKGRKEDLACGSCQSGTWPPSWNWFGFSSSSQTRSGPAGTLLRFWMATQTISAGRILILCRHSLHYHDCWIMGRWSLGLASSKIGETSRCLCFSFFLAALWLCRLNGMVSPRFSLANLFDKNDLWYNSGGCPYCLLAQRSLVRGWYT